MAKSYYEILGVSPEVDVSAIRKAYRALAMRCHPDRGEPDCTDNFIEVKEAYDTLSDPEKRRAYDLSRARTGRGRVFTMTMSSSRRTMEGGRRVQRKVHEWFTGGTFSQPERADLEILLSAREAEGGGWVPVDVPVGMVCPSCRGDVFEMFFCRTCNGTGVIRSMYRATLVIPPNVKSGTVLKLPVSAEGTTRDLHVLVFVEE